MKKRAISILLALSILLSGTISAIAGTYIVKEGDTLSQIAQSYGTTVEELARLNGISNPNSIFAGQEIKISGNSAQLKLSVLPTDFNSLKVNPDNLLAATVSGAFDQYVTVDGVIRTYKMYIPESFAVNNATIVLMPESGRDGLEFLENSGWRNIADKYKLMVYVGESTNGWANDTKYLNAFLANAKRSRYAVGYAGNNYLVGYGDGAAPAQKSAMARPSDWAGLATFGDLNISDEYMEQTGNKSSDVSYIPIKELPLPVWMFTKNTDGQVQKVIDYWRNANSSEANYYSNDLANYVYMPSHFNNKFQTNEENVAKVLVSLQNPIKYNEALNERIWTDFLSKTRRYLGIGNSDLRSYDEPEKLGLVRKTLVIDGYTREWYEYVPTTIKANPGKEVPLVVAMHGRGGSGKEFIGRSGWVKVAEDRGFIVVFPTSGFMKVNKDAVPNTNWNISNDNNMMYDDLKFIKQMVGDIKANHKIDGGRVYATGQSMGSMMSYNLALCLPDIFTATGSASGFMPDDPNYYTRPEINTKLEIPYMVMMGENDNYLGGETSPLRNKAVKRQIEYWISRFNTTALDKAATYKNGPYNNRIWYNKDGVPMIRYTMVDNLVHANLPDEAWIIYDEFLSHFYRDSSGKIIYEQGQINKY